MTRLRLAQLAALLGVASLSLPAGAQGRDAAAAQRLFEEGRVLTARGQLDEGCAKFAASEALDPAVGTLLNLATCAQRAGAPATAWRRYREAAALAVDRADPVREAVARRGIEKVEASLPKLTLAIPARGLPPGAVVRLDGTPIAPGELGKPLPVDPATHAVAVDAPGFRAWSTSAVVAEGPGVVVVPIPELAPEGGPSPQMPRVVPPPTAPPTGMPRALPPPPPLVTPLAPAAATTGGAQRTWAWIAGGTAVVALGLGAAFGASAASSWSTVRAQCPGGRCPDEGTAIRFASTETDATHAATASTVGFIVGGVAVAVSALLFLLHPGSPELAAAALRFP
ncbi:MAG TPA: hypothetical protein VGL81_06525 [Polyangiaceae bacterium]|jgi:hypothetical protein